MEDDVGPTPPEDLRQGLRVPDVAEDDVVRVQHRPAAEGQLHRVQGGLVAIEHDELGGREPIDLRQSSDPIDPPRR